MFLTLYSWEEILINNFSPIYLTEKQNQSKIQSGTQFINEILASVNSKYPTNLPYPAQINTKSLLWLECMDIQAKLKRLPKLPPYLCDMRGQQKIRGRWKARRNRTKGPSPTSVDPLQPGWVPSSKRPSWCRPRLDEFWPHIFRLARPRVDT